MSNWKIFKGMLGYGKFKRGVSPSFINKTPPLLDKERGTGGEVTYNFL